MKLIVIAMATAACGGASNPPPAAPAPAAPAAPTTIVGSPEVATAPPVDAAPPAEANSHACGSEDCSEVMGGLVGNEGGEVQGGFGTGPAGFGSGSGYGTIGDGRYHTIGHGGDGGGGYGAGGGRGAHRRAQVPKTTMGLPVVTGDLDVAIVRRYLRRNIFKMQYCYEKNLLATPDIKGTVTTRFTILPDGTVGDHTATGVSADVASCISDLVIKDLAFPKPKGGKAVTVTFTLAMQPTGGE